MAGETYCELCQSDNQRTFTGEIAIHFPGLKGVKKPIVWVFPHSSVCLNCGAAEFLVPMKELDVLRTGIRTGIPVAGAAVWLGGDDNDGNPGNEGERELQKRLRAAIKDDYVTLKPEGIPRQERNRIHRYIPLASVYCPRNRRHGSCSGARTSQDGSHQSGRRIGDGGPSRILSSRFNIV